MVQIIWPSENLTQSFSLCDDDYCGIDPKAAGISPSNQRHLSSAVTVSCRSVIFIFLNGPTNDRHTKNRRRPFHKWNEVNLSSSNCLTCCHNFKETIWLEKKKRFKMLHANQILLCWSDSGWVAVNNWTALESSWVWISTICRLYRQSWNNLIWVKKRCATRENLRRSKQKKVVQYLGINEVVVVGCDRCWRRWWYKRVDAVVICLSLFVVAFFYDARKRKEDHAGMGWRVKSALALAH